jgi:hypothetical protein
VLEPVARSRTLLGSALLLTAAAAGVVLAPGTSATSPTRTATTYGPVAALPPARPLVDVDGPLLDAPRAWQLAPVPREVGPPAAAAAVGPPASVGPASPPARVRAVQRLLNARGAGLRVDGAWGPATLRAVEAAQAAGGLPVDGRVDAWTLALLRTSR